MSALSRNCLHCQKAKIHRHVTLQAAHIPVPVRRFAHIHVDLVGPLPRSSGFSYLFTVVDRTTRWPEAVPLSSSTAADCAAALLQGWIQRFGVPDIITSDRGAAVYIFIMGEPLFSSIHLSHADHSLPSSVQRPCGAVPPPTEGCPPRQVGRSGLVCSSSVGVAGV